MQLSLFFRCLQIKAETIGILPCELFRARQENEQTVYEIASSHPLHKVLRHKPNDVDSPMEFLMRISLDLDLYGNWYGRPEYGNNGKLQAIYRLPPSCVRPLWVSFPKKVAYEYTPPGTEGKPENSNIGMQVLQPGEIVHIKSMPVTAVRSNYALCGVGLLDMQKETIGLSIAARNFAADMFRNNAVPAGILSYRGTLPEPKKRELSEQWEKRHAGDNRFKTAVITADMEYKNIARTGVEMQVFEQRQAANVDITVITGVPPAALGLNTGVTYSNTREQMRAFHSVTISQRANLIAKGLEKGLIGAKQRDKFEVRFALSEMMRGDDLVRAKYMETMVRIGAFSPNDVLAMEGRNPREGGDVYVLLPGSAAQSGKQSADDMGTAPPEADEPGPQDQEPETVDNPDEGAPSSTE